MSFASKTLFTGNGVQTQYTVSFPYISVAHVDIFVNEVLQLDPMNYTISGSTITFGTAPGDGDAIEIKRNTSPTVILVDFVNGSVLNENDLDTAYLHNYYLMQETTDSFNEVINEALVNVATGAGIVETDTDLVIAALVNEMLQDAAAASLQQRVTDIDDNAEAIIQLGADLQVQVNTLAQGVAAIVYVQASEPVPGVGGIPDPIADGARWYDSDDNNKPYIYDQTGTQWLSLEDPRIGTAVANITVLQTDVADNAAAIVTEQTARSTADSAIATDLALLGAANGGDTAFILDLSTVQIGGGETLSTRFTAITADKDANAASITTESSARATADSAIAATMALIGAENGAKTAFILDTSTVKIDSDGGDTFATRLTALGVADSDNAADITTIQTVTIPGVESDVTAIEARYGVSLNVNDYITGFLQNNDGSTGSFLILADKFGVVTPTTLWAVTTAYTVGQMRRPTSDNGRVFKCTTAGTSGGSEPTWDTTIGNTTADGSVVWTTFDDVSFQPFLIEGDKITMNGDVSINGSLMLNGTIVGSALVAGTIGSTQIGADAITTTQLNASAVTTAKLAANSVTANEINVANLAAVSADLGAITAGTIVMNTSGFIRGGQTAYDTGSGFWLGYDSSKYKFSIGDGGSNSMRWDGTTLSVEGDIRVGFYNVDGPLTNLAEAFTSRSVSYGADWTELKKFEVTRSGTIRVSATVRLGTFTPDVVSFGQYRIKVDGTVVFTKTNVGSQVTVATNVVIAEGDQFITLEAKGGGTYDSGSGPFQTTTNIVSAAISTGPMNGEKTITD